MCVCGGGGGGIKLICRKGDGVKKTSCSMCVRGNVEYTKPLLAGKKIRGTSKSKKFLSRESDWWYVHVSYKKQVLVGSYIQL